MNPSCSLPPLVDIYRAGRRGSSWGPSVHGEGWEYFSWPLLGGGGYPRGHILLVPLRGSIWSVIWLDLLVPSGARARVPRAPFRGPSRAQLFFVLFGPFEDSIFLVLRGSTFVVPRGLIFLVLSGARFLGPSGARFLAPRGGSIPFWSFEGPIFLGQFRG